MSIKTNEVTVNVANVQRHGGHAIIVPDSMDLQAVGEAMLRAAEQENQRVDLHATIDCAPFDGAWAFNKALQDQFGVAMQKAVWGERHCVQVPIDAHGGTIDIPWGRFEVPGIDGVFATSATPDDDGRFIFQANAAVQGKYRGSFNEVVRRTRDYIATASIYRGKALDLRLSDNGLQSGTAKIKFLDVVNAPRPIFSSVLDDVFEYDVLSYITHPADVQRLCGNTKLGVLLAGEFGVGKSMAAMYIARLAEENKRTFFYGRPGDVVNIIDFAKMYLPAVVLIEDVEMVAGGERTSFLNLVLNKLDGIDTKFGDLMFVATTNNPAQINPAMRRPGRIDVTLHVTPPDAKASIEIAKHYARGNVAPGEDFTEAGELLSGLIPAVIEQAVARSLIRGQRINGNPSLTNLTLCNAARAVQSERDMFQHVVEPDPIDRLGTSVGNGLAHGLSAILEYNVESAVNGRVPSNVS